MLVQFAQHSQKVTVSAMASIDSSSEFWAFEQSQLLSVLFQPKPITAENDLSLPPEVPSLLHDTVCHFCSVDGISSR